MHDCCRSRKGFGLEERHGTNDNDNSGGIFPNKFPYGRPPELSCALVGTLVRGFLSRGPASQRAVELIEQRQAYLWSTACGAQPIVVLGIKLCERYGGPLLYQFVQTHTACPCEVLEPLVCGGRQTNGECRHGSTPSKALATSATLPASVRKAS